LDRIEESLGIEGKCEASRAILKQFGNMSSATILLFLKQLLKTRTPDGNEPVLAVAFGPGLTIEMAMLEKLTAQVTHKRTIEGVAEQLR